MSRFKLGVLSGCGVGLVGFGVAAVVLLRDPIPPLTREDYAAAVQRWQERGAADYDMDVTFSGGQPGHYRVEVRGGEVTQLIRDGKSLPKRGSSWDFWTVPGMFDIVAMDLADIDKAAADATETDLKVSAEFDADSGYPRRYRRIVLGGQQPTSEWEITSFTPRADEAK